MTLVTMVGGAGDGRTVAIPGGTTQFVLPAKRPFGDQSLLWHHYNVTEEGKAVCWKQYRAERIIPAGILILPELPPVEPKAAGR